MTASALTKTGAAPRKERGRLRDGMRKALVATVLAAAPLGVSVAAAPPAAASAFSCAGYGYGFSWGYPSQFCGDTKGRGLYVETAGAGYSAPIAWAGWLTNTRIKVEFIDTRGNVYWSAVSSQQNGGSAVGAWKFTLNRNMRQGIVRYTLLSNGAAIVAVEHRIG